MWVPDRRTLIVLTCLVGAMTGASGLLLLLEPTGTADVGSLRLSALEPVAQEQLIQTAVDPAATVASRWSAIVVHYGPAVSREKVLSRQLADGAEAYHFVVNAEANNNDKAYIEAGSRWRGQLPGAFWAGPESQWVNHHAIGVLVVDDGTGSDGPDSDQLNKLVHLLQSLQAEYQIPADRVMIQAHTPIKPVNNRWFPTSWVRGQLLSYASP